MEKDRKELRIEKRIKDLGCVQYTFAKKGIRRIVL